MKKTMMCLTAVAWLWVARGQEKGIAQREPQKPVKTQRVISFKPDDRSPEKTLADLLNPSKEEKFIKVKSKGDPDHQIVTDIYDQYFKGVRVDGGQIRIVKQKGKLKYALQDYEEITTINITPKLSKEAAINSAMKKIGARKYAWQEPQREKSLKERKKDPNSSYYPKPELVILSETGQLAYKMEIFATNPWTREEVFVDAQTGAIAKKYDLLSDDNHVERLAKAPELKAGSVEQALSLNPTPIWLKIYGYDKLSSGVTDNSNQNAYLNDLLYKNHTQSIAGVTGKDPEGPFSEFNTANIDAQGFGDFRNINDINFEVAQKVHLGLESAATYFASNYSRMGYDGASGPIHAYVYSYKIGGAFYDREESLFFPYDDGEYQPEIKIHPQLQTVYHEYAHAFTVSESGLIGGSTESGVLNEALSDIWSYTVADYYLKKHPSDFGDPWTYNSLFGNTWTTTSGNQEFQDWYKSQKGYSVNRISKDPNSDNHPDFYNGQYWDPLNQDPHFNSTVISYWYYLLSVGGNVNPENDPGTTISIAGIGIEKAAKIIYLVTTNLLNANTKYEGFALRTTLAAKLIFGEDSPE
ncbi:MAG: M4 family metallopeptidase, partial [Sphingobacteriaceae bacterium]